MPIVIGLTGGIGSGKSAVSNAFAHLGVEVVDADAIAHELSVPGAAGYVAVRATFGDRVLLPSGELDRAALRNIVFADATQRARLEGVLHPLIAAHARKAIGEWKGAYGVVVVPLLLERGSLLPLVDRVLVVDCPESLQVQRVMARSAMSEAEVRAVMATQIDRQSRLERADDVIDNSGDVDAIAPQVETLDRRYRELANA